MVRKIKFRAFQKAKKKYKGDKMHIQKDRMMKAWKKELKEFEEATTMKHMSSTNLIKMMVMALELHDKGIKAKEIGLRDGCWLVED